ncbi:MAG: hypothetical protein U0228_02830 [Myxococcaceae bacterium]
MRRALLISVVALGACKKDEPEFDPATDRTLQKLKAEQERLAKKAKEQPPPPDPLTTAMAAPLKPENLGIPQGVAGDLGPIALELLEVQQSQSVSSEKVSLTTADRFLRVTLSAKSTKDVEVDLSGALLANGTSEFKLARDVMRVARGSPLTIPFRAGVEEKLVLWFEAPPEAVSKGLKIILSLGESRVELTLQ